MNRTICALSLTAALALGALVSGCNTGSRTPNVAATIESSPITTATAGQPYRYELATAGNPLPIHFTAKNLPSWLTLDGAVLSGTPSRDDVGVTGRILLVVSNGTEPDAHQSFRITVSHDGPLFTLDPQARPGVLDLPAGLSATDFTVHSAYGSVTPAADGSFSLPARGSQLIWATRGGQVQFLGISGSSLGDGLSLRSTAATLAFLDAGLTTTPRSQWDEGLNAALVDPEVSSLERTLEGVVQANQDVVSSPALRSALVDAAQSLAGSLNQRADATTAPITSASIEQVHRVTPALPRSGVMVDTGGERLLNDRRRTVFAATTLQTESAAYGDFEAIPGASPSADFDRLDETWKAFRSEGGVSILPAEQDLLVGFAEPYQVTLVGASLRSNLWPAAGTPERMLMSRAFTADAAQHHVEALSLALGFDVNELGGGRDLITHTSAAQATQSGVALEGRVTQTSEPGLWTLLEAFDEGLRQPALRSPYEASLQECVGGLDQTRLDAARGILARLATSLRDLTAKDSPAVLYQSASDPVVTFKVDPTLPGSDGGLTIVLEWGDSPADLDSHLIGPSATNGGTVHLYFVHAEASSGSPEPGHVSLDLDDTDAYGPETTAILAPEAGVYRFRVFDYSNQSDATSTALSRSNATVKVYRNGNPVPLATFTVPQGQGNLWEVFSYDGASGSLRGLSSVNFVADPGMLSN